MFDAQLEHVFTKEHFSDALSEISKNSSGLDDVSFIEFKKEFSQNYLGVFGIRVNQPISHL